VLNVSFFLFEVVIFMNFLNLYVLFFFFFFYFPSKKLYLLFVSRENQAS
jgi:hypothetical protein